MKVTKFRKSIFGRLVVTFLIIMIPIYMLGIYIYNWSLHTVKNEIANSTNAQISFYLEGLEKEVQRIKSLQFDCLNDEHLNKLASMWEIMDFYDMKENMRQLQQRLIILKNSSNYIKDVSVHILPIQKTITSNTGINALINEKYENIRINSDFKGAQIICYKNSLYLSTYQQGNLPDNNPLYIIDIELDQEAFKSSLAQFNTYRDSGSFLMSLSNNSYIVIKSDVDNSSFTEAIIYNLSKENSNGINYSRFGKKGYYTVISKSEYLDMVFLKYIPEKIILKPLQNFYIWLWVFSIAAVCIILIYSLSTYKFIHKPLLELVKSFHKVEAGDLQVSANYDSENEFGYLFKRFNDMVRNLNKLIDQIYNQKILMQRAELKQLQSQINPHFLYNSFFMINTMAMIGDENLIPFSKKLGEYFRFITRNSSDDISLIDEVNHAKAYTEIQLIRFSQRLEIQFGECPERYLHLKVPRLILQPIIENAFKHGIEKKKNFGIISISFEGNDGVLDIIIEDNGTELTDIDIEELRNKLEYDDKLEITGVINIHRRIKLVYGEKSGLLVFRSELGGLKVIMRIIIPGGDNLVQIADCG